jgi:hypothetical protein
MRDGRFIGYRNATSLYSGQGVWSPQELLRRKRAGTWPAEVPAPVLTDTSIILYAPLNGHTDVFTGPGGVAPTFVANGMVGAAGRPVVQFDYSKAAFPEYYASAAPGTASDEYILADTTAAANIGVTRTSLSFEFWVYYTGGQGGLIQIGAHGAGRAALFILRGSTGLSFYEDEGWSSSGSSSRRVGSNRALPADTWSHIYMGFVRNGNSYTAVNGTMEVVTSNFDATYDFDPTALLYLGTNVFPRPTDYPLQELIVRDTVPYTTNFTPPTSPLLVF